MLGCLILRVQFKTAGFVPGAVRDDRPAHLAKIGRVRPPPVRHLLDHVSSYQGCATGSAEIGEDKRPGWERGIVDDAITLICPLLGGHVNVPHDERATEFWIAAVGDTHRSSVPGSRLPDKRGGLRN